MYIVVKESNLTKLWYMFEARTKKLKPSFKA